MLKRSAIRAVLVVGDHERVTLPIIAICAR
jgi:hypothetical protein